MVEMLLQRGARVNATNMGDDIPLHLAVAHGHLDIVLLVRVAFEMSSKMLNALLHPFFFSCIL